MGWSVSCDPCGRCEICELLNGAVRKSGQDLIQVFANRDSEPAAAFDHGEDRGHKRSGLLTADMDPVFPIATGLIEFSAQFVDSSMTGCFMKSVSFSQRTSV